MAGAVGRYCRFMPPPSGTVGFLFTDIEGSTQLWDSVPDAMRPALERHDGLFHAAVDANDGHVFSISGDGFGAAFDSVAAALTAAVGFQAALDTEAWPDGAAIRARMGVHVGEASERDGNYFGTAVNRAARLMATAHGGQVVCSQAAASVADIDVEMVDLGAHRLRDLAAAETVFQIGGGEFPPLLSVDAVPTNLPTMRTDLIGRSDDAADLAELLRRERLVTLTGTGGVGKTRLSLTVAASVAAEFPDGCWFVELAPLADGDEVPRAVAGAMRTPATTSADLAEYLSDRRVLLVLDNCEHLLDATTDLVDDIQTSCAGVHVVATSREPLGLDGEAIRRIRSLALPDSSAGEDARSAAAVRLFVDRAVAADDRFALDDENLEAVVEICRHLDGIPLAIELAAARVRAMTPDEIARRLDERFRLLSGGSRRSQERHRTLQAAVAWSHDLLTADERSMFRRLAVFPASFDLEAAEAVADTEGDLDVVDGVLRLVDRSLVAFDPDAGRYRLLETLRQYAADRLADAGEAERQREAHARHYLEFASHIAPELRDKRFTAGSTVVARELDNLRATADWCSDQEEWAALAGLCLDSWAAVFQSAPVDYMAWLEQVIAHADHLDPQVAIDLSGELAMILVALGDFPAGARFAAQSNDLAASSSLPETPAAWVARAQVDNYAGRYPEALALCEVALAAADARGDDFRAVNALAVLVGSLVGPDDDERWEAAVQDLRDRAAATGHPLSICSSAIAIASSMIVRDDDPDFAGALEVITTDVREAAGGINDLWLDVFWGVSLLGLGRSEASMHLARATRAADRLRSPMQLDVAMRSLALAATQAGLIDEARLLVAYADAELEPYRFEGTLSEWMDGQLDDVRAEAQVHAAGSGPGRAEIMRVVGEVERALT